VADGNYTEFLRRKTEFLEAQARQQATLANEVRIDDTWLGRGAQARRTKAKGRIEDSAERRELLSELSERNTAAASGGAKVDFTASGRRTRRLLAAEGIAKSLGGKLLFRGLDLELVPGECVGLMGPNGSGKTTLIRVLTGELASDAGRVIRAEPPPRTVVLSQQRAEIPPSTLLKEAISPLGDMVRFRDREMHITAWARRFLFRDDQLIQEVGRLSGGELARAHLARMMLEPADLLILDEPTNDLDLPTLGVLEESIEEFPGATLLVTHDRAMLERLATRLVVLGAPDGTPRIVASLEQALKALGEFESAAEEAARPAVKQPAAAPPSPAKGKLSYREQREYDGIEAAIAAAEAKAAQAETATHDPKVHADHQASAKAFEALAAAQAEVTRLFARWEELEAKRGG
jgi:ATP-binding cassette subfamily F protein uup